MKNFDYHISTDIYFGKGQISKLGDNIASIGKKILLVYGGGSIKKSGLYDQVISQLDLSLIHISSAMRRRPSSIVALGIARFSLI